MTSSTFGLQYVFKFNKYLNIKNLVVCKTTSEDNNKQYLVSHFNKHDTFLRVLFLKELARSVIVHTFFDQTANAVIETVAIFESIHYIILTGFFFH